MNSWAAIGLTLSLLSACSTTTPRIQSHALGTVTAQSGERYIITAVDNDPTPFLASAGSTPHGYDSIATYGATSRAQALMHSLEKDYGLREISNWPIEPLHMHCAVLEIPAGADRAALLATISADPRIKLAQPFQTFATRSSDYNDPYVELQRGLQQMNVLEVHPWSTGDGIKVAVVDTGADIEHPDLRGRIAAAENFVDADGDRFRRDRHGTEMVGAIAAVANNHEGIVGVAPGVRIFVFKACWQLRDDADAASCNSFTLARALVAALDAHVQIINLSLTGPDDPLLRDLIHEGLRRGVIFVGALSSVPDGRGFLHQPGVIEVASVENPSRVAFALYAPGREILTLMPGGALRLCQRRFHRNRPSERRRRPIARRPSCTDCRRCLPASAEHPRSYRGQFRCRRRRCNRCSGCLCRNDSPAAQRDVHATDLDWSGGRSGPSARASLRGTTNRNESKGPGWLLRALILAIAGNAVFKEMQALRALRGLPSGFPFSEKSVSFRVVLRAGKYSLKISEPFALLEVLTRRMCRCGPWWHRDLRPEWQD